MLIIYKTVQLKTKSVSTQLSSIWPIDKTLSNANTPAKSWPGSDENEGLLHIPQISSINRTSPSDYLVLYPEQSLLGKSYPSAGVQFVYSIALVDWAKNMERFTSLRVILAQEPRKSSLYRFNFSIRVPSISWKTFFCTGI